MKTRANGNTRRAFLKGTAAAMAVPLLLTSRQSAAQTTPPVVPPSPPTTPWQEDLPDAITPLDPVNALTPSPTEAPNLAAGEAGRASHQRFSELSGSAAARRLLYEMAAKENPQLGLQSGVSGAAHLGFHRQHAGRDHPGPHDLRALWPARSSAASTISCRMITSASARPRSPRICTICIRPRRATASRATSTARIPISRARPSARPGNF